MEKNRENFLKKGLQGRGIFCRMDACHSRAVCCGNGIRPVFPGGKRPVYFPEDVSAHRR